MMNALKFPAPRRLSLLALAGFAALCSTTAMAQMAQTAPGFYVGGSLGSTRADFTKESIDRQFVGQGFNIGSSSTDNTSTGGKLFGGYQLTPNFALEGGYFDLGRFTYSGVTTGGDYRGESTIRGLNLDLVGTLPLSDRFSVLGRVGAAYAQTRDNFSTNSLILRSVNRTGNDTNVKYGFGVQYAFTDALSLRAELERYRINDPIRNRRNVDMASLGLIYRFGPKVQTPVAQAYVAPPPVYVAPPPPPPPPVVMAPAPVVVAPPPPPPAPVYVPPARPAKEGRN